MIRAVDYCRVSTDEQAEEGFSLEAQNEKNIDHIRKENWAYIRSFIDPGYSGKDLNRPGIKDLINEVRKGTLDIVVVHKLDRITRNIGDLYKLLELFEKNKVQFVSVTEKIDTSTAVGRAFIFFLGIFAQWFRENLAEEVRKGMRKRATKGFHNVTVPMYGYDRDAEGNLLVNEEEARWVNWIFEQYISGTGTRNIALQLNKMGVNRNKGFWHQEKIVRILNNWHYVGKVHWKAEGAPESERVIEDGKHEAIISIATFEKAREVMERRKRGTISKNSYEYVFGGIIQCGKCGGSYNGVYSKAKNVIHRNYKCSHRTRYGTCDQSGISEHKLSQLLFEHG